MIKPITYCRAFSGASAKLKHSTYLLALYVIDTLLVIYKRCTTAAYNFPLAVIRIDNRIIQCFFCKIKSVK